MKYDLTSMVKGRRKVIVVRPLIPPANLAAPLVRLAYGIIDSWKTRSTLKDDVQENIVPESFGFEGSRLILTIAAETRNWALRVESWHRERFAASIKAATEIDPRFFLSASDAAVQVQFAQEWASSLIRDIDSDMRRRVERIVYQGTVSQTPRREMAKQLVLEMGIEKRRALNIARDQTLKLAGNLDRMRQQEAGIDEYVWRHSGKLHPRPQHVARNGQIYRWDKPPDDGPPRTQPNCGCVAQAYINLEAA